MIQKALQYNCTAMKQDWKKSFVGAAGTGIMCLPVPANPEALAEVADQVPAQQVQEQPVKSLYLQSRKRQQTSDVLVPVREWTYVLAAAFPVIRRWCADWNRWRPPGGGSGHRNSRGTRCWSAMKQAAEFRAMWGAEAAQKVSGNG